MKNPTHRSSTTGLVALAAAAVGFAAGRRFQRRNVGDWPAVQHHVEPSPRVSAVDGRGRDARGPSQIPPRGWADIAIRTAKEFLEDEAPLVAAGVTFYSLLALFPGIGAFVALWGLFGDVSAAQEDLQSLAVILPGGAITIIGQHMANVAAANSGGLSFAALGGVIVSLWSANGATKAMMAGVGLAYEEKERRGFLRKTLISLAFTAGFLVFVMTLTAVLLARPAIEHFAGHNVALLFNAVSWAALFVVLCLGLAVLYRYGPSRDRVKWRWITWGSVAAAVLWLIASIGFSLYAANFGTYDKTYGPLGAVIGLMTWIWISSMVVLLGAELNSEIEHQTAQDSTIGAPKPLCQRGAAMADTVGAAQTP
jgi:membrane protein